MALRLLNRIRYFSMYMGWMVRHPLNRGHTIQTFGRYIAWHLGSRLLKFPVVYPFANDLRIYLRAGFWGATGVVHFGLEEYGDMAFCAHLLRPDDLFVDVGTCFGTYTLLAAGVGGAQVTSFEPNPTTAGWLVENIRLNRLEDRVDVRISAVGAKVDRVVLTNHLLGANYIVGGHEQAGGDSIEVPLTTLDQELRDANPTMIKIDVEGFEHDVLIGAYAALKKESLLAVVIEDVGLGKRFHPSSDMHQRMLDLGFLSYRYEPKRRHLTDLNGAPNLADGNTLYVRDIEQVKRRVASAKPFSIRSQII